MADLRSHLVDLLTGENAHVNFDSAVKGVPAALRGKRPKGAEHSLWQLLEHIRIGQWDILEYVRDPNHVSPKWPDGYWPPRPAPENGSAWEKSVKSFRRDRAALVALVEDESRDPLAPIPHAGGKTLLREVLLAADHNAYHIGQFVALRRLLGAWPK